MNFQIRAREFKPSFSHNFSQVKFSTGRWKDGEDFLDALPGSVRVALARESFETAEKMLKAVWQKML